MNKQKIALTLTTLFTVFIVAATILSIYPIFKFESWVNSRLKIFAEMPYDQWEALHVACEELEAQGDEFNLSRKDPKYNDLPGVIQALEPIRVWVDSNHVTLRFSGGHSQFVHIEFYGDRSPPELELITESIFDGVIFPRTDQRPIGLLHQETP